MVKVRPEGAHDSAQVRAVHLAAFETSLEADLVDQIQADGDAVISLVAENEGQVVGHILFSRMTVQSDGRDLNALALAPVAVLPDQQRQGIGAALIEAGLCRAEEIGTDIVFLVGEPDYYGRFGFEAGIAEPFVSPYSGPYLQAKALNADFKSPSRGRADYPPAFAGLE